MKVVKGMLTEHIAKLKLLCQFWGIVYDEDELQSYAHAMSYLEAVVYTHYKRRFLRTKVEAMRTINRELNNHSLEERQEKLRLLRDRYFIEAKEILLYDLSLVSADPFSQDPLKKLTEFYEK